MAVDELRIRPAALLVRHIETPCRLRRKVVHQDVGRGDELLEDRLSLGGLQIDANALLAAAVCDQGSAGTATHHLAGGITDGGLDLDHLGAKLREHVRRERGCEHGAELDDAFAGQDGVHLSSSQLNELVADQRPLYCGLRFS